MFQLRNPFVWENSAQATRTVTLPVKPPVFTATASKAPKYTCEKDETLLFEYGDGMFQMPQARVLDGAQYLAPAFSETNYSLWNKMQGKRTFPIAMRARFMPKAPVFGQLFKIAKDALPRIDNHRSCGVEFARKVTSILVPYQRTWTITRGDAARQFEDTAFKPVDVWMYEGVKQHWQNPLDWDLSFFRSAGGCDFHLAKRFKDWNLNQVFYKFCVEDTAGRMPQPDLRFFRTRSAQDQNYVNEIDITEEEEWQKALDKAKALVNDVSAYPQRSVS